MTFCRKVIRRHSIPQATVNQKAAIQRSLPEVLTSRFAHQTLSTVFNNPALVKTAQVPANNVANIPSLGGNFGNFVQGDENTIGADRNGKVPTVYSFSLGVQHEIGSGTTLDLGDVATQPRHLVTVRNVNAVPCLYAFSAVAQDPANYAGGVVPSGEPNLAAIYAHAGSTTAAPTPIDIPLLPTLGARTNDTGRLRIWIGAAPRTTTRCKHHCSVDSQRV
jgi:hypothetical protein